MTPANILADLAAAGAAAFVDGDRLKLRGKKPAETLLEAIKASKAEIIEYLRAAPTDPVPAQAAQVLWWPISSSTVMLNPPPICAKCAGDNWWRPRPGGFFRCLACPTDLADDPPPPTVPPAQPLKLPTAFLMPFTLRPPKAGSCQCCHKARWAWSPSNPIGTASDGWRRWVCANCLWEEVAYPDVVIFEPSKLKDDNL